MRVHQRMQDRVLVRKVLVQRADRQLGVRSDAVGRPGGIAVHGENVSCRIQYPLSGLRCPILLWLLTRLKSIRWGHGVLLGVNASSQSMRQPAELANPNTSRSQPMRTIHLATTLPTSADRVWRAMQSPVTFLYVCKGLFAVPALSGRAEPLRAGERGTGWLFAFHVVPAYRHTIEVIDVDEPTQTIRTHEHGGVLRVWNHTLKVQPIDESTCRYSDTVDIDAG